jgi:hypothetical protein
MRITQTHLNFWESKQHRPGWARPLLDRKAAKAEQFHEPDLIDLCVNAHAGAGNPWQQGAFLEKQAHIDTLISLSRRYVRKGDAKGLREMLANFSQAGHERFHRRAALARKWLARLEPGLREALKVDRATTSFDREERTAWAALAERSEI